MVVALVLLEAVEVPDIQHSLRTMHSQFIPLHTLPTQVLEEVVEVSTLQPVWGWEVSTLQSILLQTRATNRDPAQVRPPS